MGSFAWRNLMTRPLRTALALVGLSVPILGVMGLFSLSGGLRNLVGDTLSKIQGVMVLRENVPSPVFSDLPADLAPRLSRIPGVRIVAPEVWKVAPTLDGVSTFGKTLAAAARGQSFQGILDTPVIQGQDIVAHSRLKSAVYPRALLKGKEGGRFLVPEDRGKPHVVISKKLANDFRDAQGRPKKVG